jgi:hypothetical protein
VTEKKKNRVTYSEKIASEICQRLVDGESLQKICEAPQMPNPATVFKWLEQKPAFLRNYTLAREMWADLQFSRMWEIADNQSGDVNRDRLRIDTLKWSLARIAPKKYSERFEITGAGGGPIETEISDREIARRLAFLLSKGAHKPQSTQDEPSTPRVVALLEAPKPPPRIVERPRRSEDPRFTESSEEQPAEYVDRSRARPQQPAVVNRR